MARKEINTALLDVVEEESTPFKSVPTEGKTRPAMMDPEWSDWVMSQFASDEVDSKGAPLVHGLRRVTEQVLGPIIRCCSRIIGIPEFDTQPNSPRTLLRPAVVECEVWIDTGTKTPVVYQEVADVWDGNTDVEYRRFAVATAATRAEARALRKALRIRPCSAEEMCSVPIVAPDENGPIEEGTKSIILSMSRRLKVNLSAFLRGWRRGFSSLEELTQKDGQDIISTLSSYQNRSKPIPTELKLGS